MKHYVVLSEGSNARHVIGVFCTHEKAYKHAKEYIKKTRTFAVLSLLCNRRME
jgi:coenzyme F420-reducing hydrogenase beta subunit